MTYNLKRSTDNKNTIISQRSNRFYQKGNQWYFKTREGNAMGPFSDKEEAFESLGNFIEFMSLAKPVTRNKLQQSLTN